jgi:hypothetical protein
MADEEEAEPTLREAAERAARQAVKATDLVGDPIEGALAALQRHEYGNSQVRAALRAFTDELDNKAWDIQDRAEDGTASSEEYERAFRRARAATSLWCALDSDPSRAAKEATYEASFAVGAEDASPDASPDIANPS